MAPFSRMLDPFQELFHVQKEPNATVIVLGTASPDKECLIRGLQTASKDPYSIVHDQHAAGALDYMYVEMRSAEDEIAARAEVWLLDNIDYREILAPRIDSLDLSYTAAYICLRGNQFGLMMEELYQWLELLRGISANKLIGMSLDRQDAVRRKLVEALDVRADDIVYNMGFPVTVIVNQCDFPEMDPKVNEAVGFHLRSACHPYKAALFCMQDRELYFNILYAYLLKHLYGIPPTKACREAMADVRWEGEWFVPANADSTELLQSMQSRNLLCDDSRPAESLLPYEFAKHEQTLVSEPCESGEAFLERVKDLVPKMNTKTFFKSLIHATSFGANDRESEGTNNSRANPACSIRISSDTDSVAVPVESNADNESEESGEAHSSKLSARAKLKIRALAVLSSPRAKNISGSSAAKSRGLRAPHGSKSLVDGRTSVRNSQNLAGKSAPKSGNFSPPGSRSRNLAGLAASKSGNFSPPGSRSRNLAGVSAPTSGGLSPPGSTSRNLADPPAPKSGNLSPSGSISRNLARLSAPKSGDLAPPGSKSRNLAELSATKSAYLAPSGTKSRNLAELAAPKSGNFSPTGSRSRNIAGLSAPQSGNLSPPGSKSRNLAALSASKSGNLSPPGSKSRNLAGLAASLSGGLSPPGSTSRNLAGPPAPKSGPSGGKSRNLADLSASKSANLSPPGSKSRNLAGLSAPKSANLSPSGSISRNLAELSAPKSANLSPPGSKSRNLAGLSTPKSGNLERSSPARKLGDPAGPSAAKSQHLERLSSGSKSRNLSGMVSPKSGNLERSSFGSKSQNLAELSTTEPHKVRKYVTHSGTRAEDSERTADDTHGTGMQEKGVPKAGKEGRAADTEHDVQRLKEMMIQKSLDQRVPKKGSAAIQGRSKEQRPKDPDSERSKDTEGRQAKPSEPMEVGKEGGPDLPEKPNYQAILEELKRRK